MLKAAKQGIFILGFLLVLSLVYAGLTTVKKQELESEVVSLHTKVKKEIQKVGLANKEIGQLKKELDETSKEAAETKNKLQSEIQKSKAEIENLLSQIDDISAEKDTWKDRVDDVREERDKLMVKIQEGRDKIKDLEEALTKKTEQKVVYKDSEPNSVYAEKGSPEAQRIQNQKFSSGQISSRDAVSADSSAKSAGGVKENEEYWAGILREKVALEMEIEDLHNELSENSIEMIELKNNNEALKLELETIAKSKESIEAEIASKEKEIIQKEQMLNTISVELARAKNENSVLEDRANVVTRENQELRGEMQKLVATKNSMEKSIVKLTRDKKAIESKLGETDGLIQRKIDEIWEIKESIDRAFRSSRLNVPASNEVELAPIVVSTQGPAVTYEETNPGFNGKIVSVNDVNNFAIVDLGESSGIHVGDVLNVYHEGQNIARLEVIQVRKDISAADIKEQQSNISVGDIVR